jgi:hypothetical protein
MSREEAKWAYRQIPSEKETYQFAIKYIKEVINELGGMII